MMNSTNNDDDFGENPFRSTPGGGVDDVFFDTSPDPLQQQQAQFQQQQFPPPQQFPPQQQSFQPQSFAQPPISTFPPASGPMDNMAPQQQTGQPQMQPVRKSWWGNCMMCLSLDTYRGYFDIDADDIVTRIKSVCLDFYKPEHFRNNVLGQKMNGMKGPDLYGPFWITMTLVFFIGVTSNMHAYLKRDDIESFDYDINHLMHAGSILFGFTFVIPTVFWVTTQFMNMRGIQLVEWVCMYGYSLTPFVPAVILCVIPFEIVSFVLLLAATIASCSLIVRNLSAPLLASDSGQAKAPPVILAILGTHAIFFLVLKYKFFHHKYLKHSPAPTPAPTPAGL